MLSQHGTKMAINTDSSSRFCYSEPIVVDGKETFGRWVRPSFLSKENIDEENIVKLIINSISAGRPDLIAQEYYGDSKLEWIVVMFNRPLNPIGWPRAGTVIEIPQRSILFTNQ